MRIALLITTYNWTEALNLVLMSVQNQSRYPDEILIADDGSTEDTKILIDSFRDKIPVPIKHIWQEDKGFRKTKILNKTIIQSEADYIIQVDGDCILHRKFVEDHINNISPNTFLYGARANITSNTVEKVIANNIIHFKPFSKLLKKKTRSWRIPILSRLYKPQSQFGSIRGCNMSYWKKDFIDINGYNEDMEGWGGEDIEFAVRLLSNKINSRRLRYLGIMYHIYHKPSDNDNISLNDSVYQSAVIGKSSWCNNGVNKYLKTYN